MRSASTVHTPGDISDIVNAVAATLRSTLCVRLAAHPIDTLGQAEAPLAFASRCNLTVTASLTDEAS